MKLGKLQKKWIASLKKYPERQIDSHLGSIMDNGDVRCCCLGQAGLILNSCEWKNNRLIERMGGAESYLNGSHKWMGLYSPSGEIDYPEDSPQFSDEPACLANMNDDGHHTWTEIAYILEAIPEYFFNKTV